MGKENLYKKKEKRRGQEKYGDKDMWLHNIRVVHAKESMWQHNGEFKYVKTSALLLTMLPVLPPFEFLFLCI